MDDISFDAVSSQSTRQPKAVTASLQGNCDAFDRSASAHRLLAPAVEQLEERGLIGGEFLQWSPITPWNDSRDQPTGLAHFDYGDQSAILIQSGTTSAQVG